MALINIDGLTESQKKRLADVKITDVIMFVEVAAPEDGEEEDDKGEGDSEEDDESGSEKHDHGDWEDASSSDVDDDADPDADEDEDADAEATTERDEDDRISNERQYLVHDIVKDAAGNVEDIKLLALDYSSETSSEQTFQLYGNAPPICATSKPCTRAQCTGCEESLSLFELAQEGEIASFKVYVNVRGDSVRAYVTDQYCPLECDEGWLLTIGSLDGLVKDYDTPATLAHRPVCPVCIGQDLMKEHEGLRFQLEVLHMPDWDALLNFYERLNPRRARIGYQYQQFDEREWNTEFEDMPSSDEDGDGAQIEQ